MQIGGHIELNETPWQTMVHELQEESGYKASELMVLQPTSDRITESATVYHPVPFIANTHGVGNEHYHSDWCYGFVASERPQRSPALSESTDLRWLTIEELKAATVSKTAVADVLPIYQFLLDHLESYVQVPASGYSVKKPTGAVATYKRGAPGANN
ncbi:MAG TPA: NUDIX domain-containing protein [Candidatus Saccharimonadales bacterium]|nr:NUDIX domain-containing protein [Candidatus Saccharimonadales bacterium]